MTIYQPFLFANLLVFAASSQTCSSWLWH